jgi:hypothetical protein
MNRNFVCDILPKYYCLLCETSHPEVKPSITCPSCGRIFCKESIKQSFSVGKTGCPYCDHSFEEVEKSKRISLLLEDENRKSSFQIFRKLSKSSTKQEKQNLAIYVLIGCMTLPFIAIIALMFLRVFFMFFEIFFN